MSQRNATTNDASPVSHRGLLTRRRRLVQFALSFLLAVGSLAALIAPAFALSQVPVLWAIGASSKVSMVGAFLGLVLISIYPSAWMIRVLSDVNAGTMIATSA